MEPQHAGEMEKITCDYQSNTDSNASCLATGFMLRDLSGFTDTFLHNKAVPLWLLLFGSAGQVIFALRFIYQFLYSAAHHQSVLPLGFWLISLLGSSIIVAYALFRLDPVLILGQSFGFVAIPGIS
jgi:lipid-A-disaccharide synthase-like uncharacterized protein